MRSYDQDWQSGHLRNMLSNVQRRRSWFLEDASVGQVANIGLAAAEFAGKREKMRAWPVIVKVDISPACNLGCTFCVHADPDLSPSGPNLLAGQNFKGKMMPLDQFTLLTNEIRGKSAAVSLYYLGDPLVHPDLVEICGISRRAGLKTHISSNFSFRLSDDRIRELVTSGLTHLTVCVDSMRQERFERTRVGGRIDWVLDNLQRVLVFRRELGARWPKVEVQFIKFQHNLDELAEVTRWCRDRGVDQLTSYWGNLHNYTDLAPGRINVTKPKTRGALPKCSWPHFSLQVKYDGSVIPCCYYRQSEQYRDGGDDRSLGNVFEGGLRRVWNSPGYQRLRRLVNNPEKAGNDPASAESFCHGCPTVYDTDVADRKRLGSEHQWEDLYVREPDGRMRRL